MSINNGGPAYPQPCTEDGSSADSPYRIAGGGLSRRAYFAAKAMQPLLLSAMQVAGPAGGVDFAAIAAAAHRMADAMIKAGNTA